MAKKHIRAFVSDPSHAGWLAYAERHGVSVSALVEGLGQIMAECIDEVPLEHATQAIERAREVDAERRRRD